MPRVKRYRFGTGAPPGGAGTVLWDGNMSNISDGPWTVDGTTVFMSSPNPYSSIQSAGNDASHTATLSLDSTVNRNSRETKSLKMVMQPGSQRCQPTSRSGTAPLNGRWTADSTGTVDHWYGWSMMYHTDWGDTTTLNNEISGTMWHDPIAWRTSGANGSVNISGDETDNDNDGGSWTSTPRTLYLRRNTVLNNANFYTDGLGVDKINLGQVVTGTWMDFVVHIRWSTTTNNAVREAWRDGVYMGAKYSLNAVDTLEHSLRVGIYQTTAITHTRTAWYSNVRIGTSYSAVDPTSTI